MRDELLIPDLRFSTVMYGPKETEWDLRPLLYKGGATFHSKKAAERIASGNLGNPQLDRLDLVKKLHDEIQADLNMGGSRETALSRINHLRLFFGWADRNDRSMNINCAVEAYCAWADSLTHRVRIERTSINRKCSLDRKPITMNSAYAYCASVGTLLDRILERRTNVIELTRLIRPNGRKAAIGSKAEKQSLEHTFKFGNLLQDICDTLTVKTVLENPLPIQIKLRSGETLFRSEAKNYAQIPGLTPGLEKRYSLANLRIEAELMMFIGQTGMNLTQAQNLEWRHFSYTSHLEGFQVRSYKARRGGSVLFEIFKSYRPHFERYLEWRRKILPNSNRVFPFIRPGGSRNESRFKAFRLRAICSGLNIPFVGPQSLRNTRVNWLLRADSDPDQTAEAAQHTKKTLLGVYHRPSLQRAMAEATRFWEQVETNLLRTTSVAPGGCTGHPRKSEKAPSDAPQADCSRPSGCLWCENHRDIDSQDYVWALTSFRYLKLIELSKTRSPGPVQELSPTQCAITRINEKLKWFELSSSKRCEWVVEAHARINEGNYHPDWELEIGSS